MNTGHDFLLINTGYFFRASFSIDAERTQNRTFSLHLTQQIRKSVLIVKTATAKSAWNNPWCDSIKIPER